MLVNCAEAATDEVAVLFKEKAARRGSFLASKGSLRPLAKGVVCM